MTWSFVCSLNTVILNLVVAKSGQVPYVNPTLVLGCICTIIQTAEAQTSTCIHKHIDIQTPRAGSSWQVTPQFMHT
ncbi:hypothetical protein BYT27DRAFT_6542956 [Phlegmacium glaucopus]|nr:hypothetical protein BYT27DRAFT_6542956 [Phlegmacium glaucopus]